MFVGVDVEGVVEFCDCEFVVVGGVVEFDFVDVVGGLCGVD